MRFGGRGNAKTYGTKGAGWVAAGVPFGWLRARVHVRARVRVRAHAWRRRAVGAICPARRAGLAQPGGVGGPQRERRRAAGAGAVAFRGVRARRRQSRVRRAGPEPDGSLFHRSKRQPDPDPRLDRCVHLRAQRVRGAGRRQRRCRGRGEFRPRAQRPPRRERGRSQLSRHFERTGFAAHLDQAQHGGRRAPRQFRAAGRRGPDRARDSRERGRRRDLDGRLQRRHHRRGPVCAGRGLHDRRRRRPDAGRWLRQLLEGLRHRRGEPARGGGRHRGRDRAHRQRGPEPGPVLGAQGRRRRDLRRRHPVHAAHP